MQKNGHYKSNLSYIKKLACCTPPTNSAEVTEKKIDKLLPGIQQTTSNKMNSMDDSFPVITTNIELAA